MRLTSDRAVSTEENLRGVRSESQVIGEAFSKSPNLNALSSQIGAHFPSVFGSDEIPYFFSSSAFVAHLPRGATATRSNSQLIDAQSETLYRIHQRSARSSALSADASGSSSNSASAGSGSSSPSTAFVFGNEQQLFYSQFEQQLHYLESTSSPSTYEPSAPLSSQANSRQFPGIPEMHLSFMLKGCVLFVMFALSLAFNALAASKLARHASRLSIYRLMFHLTLADMIVSFSGNLVDGVWLFTYEWLFGAALCKARSSGSLEHILFHSEHAN